jgi:hypothetical protein
MRLLFLLLLLPFAAMANIKGTDSIFLYNGQVLIGQIQGAQTGVITIDDIDLKLTNVKLYKIRRLSSPHRFRIETTGRNIYYGSLEAAEQNGHINIIMEDSSRLLLALVNINLLIPLERDFFKRLDGNLSAGFSYTKSSNIGQVNFNGTATYATRLFENQLSASELGSIDSGKFSRDNENVELFSNYNITPSWFAAGLLNYQRNLELSISRRYQEMIGGGNKLVVQKSWQLLAITGIAFNQEKSTSGELSGLLLEIPVMLRFNLYKFTHPNIQITSSQTAYISLGQQGRIRYSGSTTFAWELVRYFYLDINPYTNFDSKPPGTSSTFDFGISISISYRF